MLETSKNTLEAMLKNATEPDAIKELTNALDDLKAAQEAIALKDGLITRQSAEIKRLYLNDTPAAPITEAQPKPEAQKEFKMRTLEEIIADISAKGK